MRIMEHLSFQLYSQGTLSARGSRFSAFGKNAIVQVRLSSNNTP